LNLNDYQMEAGKTAIYPEEGEGSPAALAYTALGLTGEAGEVANKVKKLLRDGDQPELRQAIIDELGDVLWYVAMTAHELAIPLDEVAARNLDKLQQRQQTGTIGGSGDQREVPAAKSLHAFKVGDRVRVEIYSHRHANRTGTNIDVSSVYPGAWRVQFDDDGSWLSFYSHEITALGAEADA